MATHQFQTSPGGIVAPDSTLAPPTVIETDSSTKNVPSMLRIHIQDANLSPGCNPYGVVSVGANSAHTKQLLSSENSALASTGYAYFDEQFVVEYDPRHAKDSFVSVAFFERATNSPLGEWRAPISNFDHSSRGFLGLFGKHATSSRPQDHSWELLEGVSVPLAPYVGTTTETHHHHGVLSHLKPHHHTTTATTPTTTGPTTTAYTPAYTSTTATTTGPATTAYTPAFTTGVPSTSTPTSTGVVGGAPLPLGSLGSAHIRVRSEPKLVGELRLAVKEIIITGATGATPIFLNAKFAAPEQKFTTELTNGIGNRFVFPASEFLFRIDPSNNVRDVFIEVIQNGISIGETRVTLYDAYRPGGLAAAQPILVHSTKTRIGDMILSAVFNGKVQKR